MTTHKGSHYLSKGVKRTTLSIALGMCFAGAIQAQSTSGGISGTAGEGTTVVISNNSGFRRTVTVDASGRYSVGSLPVGSYKVTAQRGGQTIGARDVAVIVGRNAEVSFVGDSGTTTLETVTVTDTRIPPIDVTALDTRTIITAEQLQRLPIERSAEAIALLAPGANPGSGASLELSKTVSFGGAGGSENAYYINGYFAGEPLSNVGGFSMPYNSVEQQETYTGGYSARYGRSDGGVINQVGKSGSNEVHFGGQLAIMPKSARQQDTYYPNIDLSDANSGNLPSSCGEFFDQPCQYTYQLPDLPGKLFIRDSQAEQWSRSLSGYVSGPLIKDRLFAFVSAEAEWQMANSAPMNGSPSVSYNKTSNPKIYAKLNWNITDNHLLEYTYLFQDQHTQGRLYEYDWEAGSKGALIEDAFPTERRTRSEFSILKYTGYLTDNLTLNATYGRGNFWNLSRAHVTPGQAYLFNDFLQNPAITGGTPINNNVTDFRGRDGRDYTRGLRAELEWVLGDHRLTAGIDNLKTEARNEGNAQLAPIWDYGRRNGNISPGRNVGSPVSASNPDGYYVAKVEDFDATDMALEQKAWFLEDRWQITDNFLLSLGIRNDEFTNTNNVGEVYMAAKNQWAPRIGASWDIFGDSTFKLFANAGRYFLAMPNSVAIRGASASTQTSQYYTYTGIDPAGNPTGLTPVPGVDGTDPPGPVSSNDAYGQPVDVLAFTPKDLKNMYQDEYILGFQKTWGSQWTYGAKLTYRDLKSSIDDVCDTGRMRAALEARGIDPNSVEISGCYMFNPGGTNTFSLKNVDGSGRTELRMTAADWGLSQGAKRVYKALDLYLERPFDGKWEARIDYTYSKLQGNTEGQVKSESNNTNVSKTQNWDAAELMAFSDGYLFNDHRHQLKIRGSYQITPEWMVSGNLSVRSGAPVGCLGFYNPDGSIDENTVEADPASYGPSYHTCFGKVVTPGDVRTPWTFPIDLGVVYRPAMFEHKLALGLQVLNVLNQQRTTQFDTYSQTQPYTVSNWYRMPVARQAPRQVMLTASFDF